MSPPATHSDITDRLRSLKDEHKSSLQDIAAILGQSVSRVGNYHSPSIRRSPSIEDIAKLADFYSVSTRWLATGQGPRDVHNAMSGYRKNLVEVVRRHADDDEAASILLNDIFEASAEAMEYLADNPADSGPTPSTLQLDSILEQLDAISANLDTLRAQIQALSPDQPES